MIREYLGTRLSDREASLLQLREDALWFGTELPESLEKKARWLIKQCERVADWKATHA